MSMSAGVPPKLWIPRVILDAAGQAIESRNAVIEATSNEVRVPGTLLQKAQPGTAFMRSYGSAEEKQRQQAARESNGRFFGDMYQLNGSANAARAMGKPPQMLSQRALRMLSRGSIIDRLIINARKAQARRFARICDVPGKQFGFRVVHRRYQDAEFDSDTDDIRARCDEMEKLLRTPTNPPHPDFGDWLENAVEEELVLDRRFLVLPQGRGGRPVSYHLIDGATVYPRIEVLGRWMIANHVADYDTALAGLQMELWKDPPRDGRTGEPVWVDIADAEYVQMIDDRVVGAWKQGEYHMAIAHSTVAFDSWGYGYSALEDSYSLSLIFLEALRFNKNLFDVNFPEAVLVLGGAYDDEGLKAFRRNILDYDPREASSRLPVVAGGEELQASLLKLRDTPRDMMMSELITMLANFKCAAYRMHPSTINVQPDGQGGAVVSVDNSQGDEISQATEEGFHSLMQGQADFLTAALVARRYDDLIVIVEGLDRENEQALLARLEFEAQYSTFNEVRAALNKKPLPKGLPVEIGDFVGGEAWMGAYQAIQGGQQQQQQQSMGNYEQGDFGQPQGDPGQPWQGAPGQQQPGQPGQPGQPPGQPGQPGQGQPGMPPPQQGGMPPQQGGGMPLRRSREELVIRVLKDGEADWEDPWQPED
jgi:hypothetical protein